MELPQKPLQSIGESHPGIIWLWLLSDMRSLTVTDLTDLILLTASLHLLIIPLKDFLELSLVKGNNIPRERDHSAVKIRATNELHALEKKESTCCPLQILNLT